MISTRIMSQHTPRLRQSHSQIVYCQCQHRRHSQNFSPASEITETTTTTKERENMIPPISRELNGTKKQSANVKSFKLCGKLGQLNAGKMPHPDITRTTTSNNGLCGAYWYDARWRAFQCFLNAFIFRISAKAASTV